MGTLASLTVELEAQSKQFQAGITQIESRLKSFERTTLGSLVKTEAGFRHLGTEVSHIGESFSGIGEKAVRAFELFGAVAAGGALGHLVREALEAGQQIDEMSKRLGLGIRAMQEFHFAALQTGIGVEQFDATLTRFATSIGQAAENGRSKAGKLFHDLGVEVLDAGKNIRPTEEVFREFLDALNEKVPTAAERLGLLKEAAGRGGTALAPLVGELDELAKQAEKTGAVMDPEMVEKAAALNRQWEAAEQVIKTRLNVALIALGEHFATLPTFIAEASAQVDVWAESWSNLSDQSQFALERQRLTLTNLIDSMEAARAQQEKLGGGNFIDRLMGDDVAGIDRRLAVARTQLQKFDDALDAQARREQQLESKRNQEGGAARGTGTDPNAKMQQTAREQIAVLTQQAALYDQVRAGSLDYKAALTQMAIAEQAAHLHSIPLATALVTAKEHFDQSKKAVEDDRKALEQRAEALQHNLDRQLSLIRSIENERASLEAEIAIIQKGAAERESYGQVLHNLAVEHERMRLQAQGFNGDAGKEAEGLVNLREQADGYRASLDRVHEAGVRTLHDLADGFMNMVETGDFSFRNLEQIGLRVWRDITQEIIDNSIDKAMRKSASGGGGGGELFGFLGSLIPALFGGSSPSKGVTGAQLMETPVWTAQHGGLVPGSGPVPMILHGGELVLSAAQTDALMAASTRHIPTDGFSSEARGASGAGSRGTTVVVNIQAQDVQSFRRSESRIAARLGGAVERANRRNN